MPGPIAFAMSAPNRRLSIVLINPRFRPSHWGRDHALPLQPGDKRAWTMGGALPLLAALTPAGHDVRLLDESVEPIDFDGVDDVDIIGLTGMIVQRDRMKTILEGNVIQPLARIGDNVIMWSGNHIGHHTVIEDHCFITSQVGIGGNSQIGARTFMGGQSGLVDNRRIGRGCIVGAGATVLQDLPDGALVTFTGTTTQEKAAARFAKVLLG